MIRGGRYQHVVEAVGVLDDVARQHDARRPGVGCVLVRRRRDEVSGLSHRGLEGRPPIGRDRQRDRVEPALEVVPRGAHARVPGALELVVDQRNHPAVVHAIGGADPLEVSVHRRIGALIRTHDDWALVHDVLEAGTDCPAGDGVRGDEHHLTVVVLEGSGGRVRDVDVLALLCAPIEHHVDRPDRLHGLVGEFVRACRCAAETACEQQRPQRCERPGPPTVQVHDRKPPEEPPS